MSEPLDLQAIRADWKTVENWFADGNPPRSAIEAASRLAASLPALLDAVERVRDACANPVIGVADNRIAWVLLPKTILAALNLAPLHDETKII
jgi:hypothetical protein